MKKKLQTYKKKRDFSKSPEPSPGLGSAAGEDRRGAERGAPIFVVHRHDATRLHYDLRLEMDGVLKSWAVPRGFSYISKDKHLAVRTEDHPIEYEHFDGVIPKGEYGAGTMTIWDRGAYEVLKTDDPAGAVAAGKLEVRLLGKRLRGEWHLVRTTRGENEWLLFKARDRYARTEEDLPYPFMVDLDVARRVGLPRTIEAMRPRRRMKPFSDPDWIFEMELDGIRVLVWKRGDRVRLREAVSGAPVTNGIVTNGIVTNGIDDIVKAVRDIRAENAVLDGVLVSLDATQRPSRKVLKDRLRGTNDATLSLCAFDLLYYDEWNTRALRLIERKRLLRAILPRNPSLSVVEHVQGEGEKLYALVRDAGLPGIVAKDSASAYSSGLDGAWRRLRVTQGGKSGISSGRSKGAIDYLRSLQSARSSYGRVAYTNRNKVFWPEQSYTKGDLIHYYEQIGEYLLPYLHERPLTMRRFPDGVDGKSFYHKNAPIHSPEWVLTEAIRSAEEKRTIRYVICNDRETLLYLANLGSIDLHPWMSRRGHLDTPDWLVLDLDPDRSPFSMVVRVARVIGKLLQSVGLRPYLKTSGASGIHIVIPLLPRYTYDQARMFAEGVARYVAQEHPDITTVERVVARRRGRVYIDFLQNRRGQTVVPPYVARPVSAASVSTPLDWDELGSDLDPAQFTIETVPPRVAQRGDLFHATLTDKQDIAAAAEAFQELVRRRT